MQDQTIFPFQYDFPRFLLSNLLQMHSSSTLAIQSIHCHSTLFSDAYEKHGQTCTLYLSSRSLRIFVSISMDRVCICFLEKYRITNNVAIIPIASPMPKYSTKPISDISYLHIFVHKYFLS